MEVTHENSNHFRFRQQILFKRMVFLSQQFIRSVYTIAPSYKRFQTIPL